MNGLVHKIIYFQKILKMETKCKHEWIVQGNKNVCKKCGKSDLLLKDTNYDGLKIGIKSNGLKYSVRTNRHRYFFPNEWEDFITKCSENYKIIFETLLITGARIQEAMMIKKSHIKIDNRYLILYTTKVKAKKQEKKSKQREITLPKSYLRLLKTYINEMKDDDYIFLNNKKLIGLDINQIKKIAKKKSLDVYQAFKRILNKTKIEDKWNFSLHNIRKTTGMWLKTLNVKMEEICFRLGHDMNTYNEHYGSSDRFEARDKTIIANKFSGIYGIQ
jgi:integrase